MALSIYAPFALNEASLILNRASVKLSVERILQM
jgi:hypothetical protein